ncbi:hypothetical protein, partial [Pseudomonas fluorescens]|uniref:hypothetical protein n=1 Tax=Pseudomonas fluorescens TaxID=294 RepID=UPI0004BE2C76
MLAERQTSDTHNVDSNVIATALIDFIDHLIYYFYFDVSRREQASLKLRRSELVDQIIARVIAAVIIR